MIKFQISNWDHFTSSYLRDCIYCCFCIFYIEHSSCLTHITDHERHFMLHCEINSSWRGNCITEYAIENPDFNNIFDYD